MLHKDLPDKESESLQQLLPWSTLSLGWLTWGVCYCVKAVQLMLMEAVVCVVFDTYASMI